MTGKLNTFAPHASVIHMDIDPAEMNKLRQAHAALQGDLNALLPALQQPLNIDDWQQHCAQLRDEHAWRYDHPGDAIYAPLLLKQLSDRKPADCIVTTDVGQHQMWSAQHIVHTRPENFITSSGLGTMGFGLPAAVGAQVARPNDTVVCISGDGSFMMNVQELGTVKRKQLPLKIVLLDNQRLGMVRQWQQLFFQERYSETTLTDNPDFLMLASAFGIPGQHITRKDQVEAALDTMLNSDGPYLLHVSIDELENVWPLVPPGASNSEMLEKFIMMQHQVNVSARFNPETLERVLRVVRHRGFHVCSMNMAAASDAQNINIELTVASPRSVDLLFSQLNKLVDVAHVAICQSTTTSQQIRA